MLLFRRKVWFERVFGYPALLGQILSELKWENMRMIGDNLNMIYETMNFKNVINLFDILNYKVCSGMYWSAPRKCATHCTTR